jgi:hypothetical protein
VDAQLADSQEGLGSMELIKTPIFFVVQPVQFREMQHVLRTAQIQTKSLLPFSRKSSIACLL